MSEEELENQKEQEEYKNPLFESLVKENEEKEKPEEKKLEEEKPKPVNKSKKKKKPPVKKEAASSPEVKEEASGQVEEEVKEPVLPEEAEKEVVGIPPDVAENPEPSRKVVEKTFTGSKQKLRRPYCPYCGEKASIFQSWVIKNKGEYFCTSCGNYSNIHLDKLIYLVGIAALSISLILLLIFSLTGMTFLGVILILLPFLLFFGVSPFLVRIKKMIHKKSQKAYSKTVSEKTQHVPVNQIKGES